MTTIHTAITGNITSTLSLNPADANGDLWVVSGAQFATGNNTALDINPGGTNTILSFEDGASIWNGGFVGVAIDLESNASIHIGVGSTIESGANYPAGTIRGTNGTKLDIVNHGSIFSGGYAISANNSAQNHLANYGTITAVTTVYLARSNSAAGVTIENYGSMQVQNPASDVALNLSDGNDAISNFGTLLGRVALQGGKDSVFNSGVMQGGDWGTITIWGDGPQGKSIINSGSIINSAGHEGWAISLNGGDDEILNSGKIVGTVHMWGGSDTFHMQAGGTIDGDVWLGTGNDTADIDDGHGAHYLGEEGDDMFIMRGTGKDYVDGGSDVGGADNDTLDYSGRVESVTLKLAGSGWAAVRLDGLVEDHVANIESVYGSAVADRLTGDARNNLFVGNGGRDTIDGGAGVDGVSYAKEGAGISVALNGAKAVTVKIGGVGQDSIRNIETVMGTLYADKLTGDAQANVLHGNSNDDTLAGGGGHDKLYGEGGKDSYVFNTKVAASSSDSIDAFMTGQDKILLDHKMMKALGSHAGGIGTQFYHAAGATHGADKNDHVVYNDTDGHLYYDSNGSAAGGVTLLAVLTGAPALAAADVFII